MRAGPQAGRWPRSEAAAVVGLALAAVSCTRTQVYVTQAGRETRVKRVAVMDFAYSYTGRESPKLMNVLLAGSYVNPSAGRIVADRLSDEMLRLGSYRLVERSQIEAIIKEHEFRASDYASPAGLKRLGSLLDVDALLVGSVDLFRLTWVLVFLRSDVGFGARLVHADSGEILWSARGRRSFYYAAPEDVADGLVARLADEIGRALAAASVRADELPEHEEGALARPEPGARRALKE